MNLPTETKSSKPASIFVITVLGPSATAIANGNLPAFVTMLRSAGGLRWLQWGRLYAATWPTGVAYSAWGFCGWWDARRFEDYLIDEHWDPAMGPEAFDLRQRAALEPREAA